MIHHRTAIVDGLKIFYREAGQADTGDPASARLPVVIAHVPQSHPDARRSVPRHRTRPSRLRLLGGAGQRPVQVHVRPPGGSRRRVRRSTESPTLCDLRFDYGAPVGLRLALAHPERVTAIISQNGNAYEEGLSEGWNPIQKYWKDPTEANRAALRDFLKPEATRWQYLHGVSDEAAVAPESYTLDSALLGRAGNDEIQLDLFLDYASNVALYPGFQAYFREHQPPILAVWGKNDPFFLPPGAEAFKRDVPGADVGLIDTGHFALETYAREIATAIREFLGKTHAGRAASDEPAPMLRRA